MKGLIQISDGSFIIAGSSDSYSASSDGIVVKISSDGIVERAMTYGGVEMTC